MTLPKQKTPPTLDELIAYTSKSYNRKFVYHTFYRHYYKYLAMGRVYSNRFYLKRRGGNITISIAIKPKKYFYVINENDNRFSYWIKADSSKILVQKLLKFNLL